MDIYFWAAVAGIVGTLLAILAFFFGNKPTQNKVKQTHYGTGDNVGKDKIIK